ncbi:MAG: alpha-2-macroglobulin family protein [Pirellulales bacterium]
MRRIVLLGLLTCVFASVVAAVAGPRDGQWKKVDEAVMKGLPKTAIEELKPIIDSAVKEKRYAEAIKAIAKTIELEGQIEGGKPEEKVVRMKAQIEKAPAEMKPVLNALLANWYWQYFQANNWRFLQRTQTAAAPSDDFETWDLPRIMAEIDKQFAVALADAPTLQKIPIADYDDLLVKGTASDAHRPTLFDFLAFNALEFYASGEQAGAKAEDAYELPADGPAFGSIEDFLAWKPESTDESSATLRAVRLYQQLLQFHLRDDDRTALLDADLHRLVFAHNKAVGEDKDERYTAALKRFADKHQDHPLSALARAHWAAQLFTEGDYVEARKVASEGLARYPQSHGGARCHNLVQTIESRELNITTERVWNEPWPSIQIQYRNFTKLHFRVVPYDFDQFVKQPRWSPLQLDEPQRRELLAKPAAQSWTVDLPATDDFKLRIENYLPKVDLKPGAYFLIASPAADFSLDNNPVHFGDFWRSDLSLVMRIRHGAGALEGFVLDAKSGQPIAGAQVQAWLRENNGAHSAGEKVATDGNGLFRLSRIQQRGMLLDVKHGDQRLASAQDYAVFQHDATERPQHQTFFFTDRAIYRPGQTIQYKGISVRIEHGADKYKTLGGHTVEVVFSDPNGNPVEKRTHKTNDYGSFSGSFTAPRDRLTGQMTIAIQGNRDSTPGGATTVQVEEYKRPKFQVALEAPKTAAKLHGDVQLTGKATAYTGAAIDGAKVRWRVVREMRYPTWWWFRCWWMPPMPAETQEIAHGTATTSANGSFPIQFVAKPDPKADEEGEPTFTYTVHADVTDTAGETRSADRTVTVGFTALAASLAADDWQQDDKPVAISIHTSTLDGEGQVAEGSVKVYRVQQPDKVARPHLGGGPTPFMPMPGRRGRRGGAPRPAVPLPPGPVDPNNVNAWPLGDVVLEQGVTTDAQGHAKLEAKLAAGLYRAKFETKDRFGKAVTAELPIRVLAPTADKLSIKLPEVFAAPKWRLEPGGEFTALWGTGYESGRAYVEIEHRQKKLQSFWTDAGKTQVQIKQAVTEAMRGGFSVHVTYVRENRAYFHSQHVDVPWTNKELQVKWEHFVSKLEPNQKEKWTAIITGPNAEKAVAEMVAGLYDASLDAYVMHDWMSRFPVFRQNHSVLHQQFENMPAGLQHLLGNWNATTRDESLSYRSFPPDVVGAFVMQMMYARRGRAMMGGLGGGGGAERLRFAMPAAPAAAMDAAPMAMAGAPMGGGMPGGAAKADFAALADGEAAGAAGAPGKGPDLGKVAPRKNLQETAFFFPHLISNKQGEVRIEFTIPEALTEWKFLGFAHDADLRSGYLTDKVVTAKDLMIQPNPPRFVREGDELEFTVKVSNQSAARQTGKVKLNLADARTSAAVDAAFANSQPEQEFDIPSKESRTVSWRIKVPDDASFVTYTAVGSTGHIADGEEGFLPVLSRRILVTESLPLPIRGQQTKDFTFGRLVESGKSDSLKHKSYTVQMVSNPSWYAVMALPYLMEYPHECSEQTFNRLYANLLARHIAESDPKIRRVFDQWKGTPALDSPLVKNQDLKQVMIEETPWLRQADAESEARRNVGILFDQNRLESETQRLIEKLEQLQFEDGAWPWFPGGRPNDYITLYITTGFGRLRHLGVDVPMDSAIQSLGRLDAWVDRMYRDILKRGKKDENHLSSTVALYLYCRSFYLEDSPLEGDAKEAVDYWLGQSKKHWLSLDRQSQAHVALALKRFGDAESAQGILKSLKERSVSNEELGMFWRDTERSWWWYRAPIETQAMMIEAFDEVANDPAAVEDCKVWLLKQKQTQDWKTTKATADAVYSLLLRGSDQLASDALVEVTVGGQTLKPEKVEAGTGFFEQRLTGPEIKPELGKITLKKVDDGVAWGSVHWQYLEDMSKVTAYDGTPLKLRKTLYTKQPSKKGPELVPVAGPLAVGDELVVRVELRVDRDMEYVHLKDQRGSGTEPMNVLSGYRYQDGLAYYESTKDTASHFFIDYLPKGTYVFEYSTRVQLKGRYQTGVATIQSMYAPEFNSHSESHWLEVK